MEFFLTIFLVSQLWLTILCQMLAPLNGVSLLIVVGYMKTISSLPSTHFVFFISVIPAPKITRLLRVSPALYAICTSSTIVLVKKMKEKQDEMALEPRENQRNVVILRQRILDLEEAQTSESSDEESFHLSWLSSSDEESELPTPDDEEFINDDEVEAE